MSARRALADGRLDREVLAEIAGHVLTPSLVEDVITASRQQFENQVRDDHHVTCSAGSPDGIAHSRR